MSLVFPIVTLAFMLIIALVKPGVKGTMAVLAVGINALASSWVAINALLGQLFTESLNGGIVFGNIPIRVDGLSAWFILLTNFTLFTGILYGRQYMKRYGDQTTSLSLHYISFLLNQLALTGIYFIQNSLAFLCVWELMALSAFMLVIFEHGRMKTLKAGINYLIQSHISFAFIALGFIWVSASTGSFDFSAITQYAAKGVSEAGLLLFIVFFIGFAIKAGFVPFHTWLPHAHPAAPAHVSGVMSGVLIKVGIYGILRMLLLIPDNHLVIGYGILLISVISGIYGVMLATVQHNIKRLLAYHSIENIGIIGIGIGIGAIGSGIHNSYLAFAGYAGALLHTLNHSLFKSLLFYCSGILYQATHTLNIEKLGGLIKKMPHTALLFLIAALAICGLPPFNGFISEFLIYSGLFHAIAAGQSPVFVVLAAGGLALTGGLALMCFTKAFGIIFLGTSRHPHAGEIHDAGIATLLPGYLIVLFIACIGLMPQLFLKILRNPVELFAEAPVAGDYTGLAGLMQHISLAVWGLAVLVILLFFIRILARNRMLTTGSTWGCGYENSSPKLQYTAGSFIRSYAGLIKPLVITKKHNKVITDIIPEAIYSETNYYDKAEAGLVDWPVRNLKALLGKFKFLQNGSVQFYVLYGLVFIAISIAIPMIINAIQYLSQMIKQL